MKRSVCIIVLALAVGCGGGPGTAPAPTVVIRTAVPAAPTVAATSTRAATQAAPPTATHTPTPAAPPTATVPPAEVELSALVLQLGDMPAGMAALPTHNGALSNDDLIAQAADRKAKAAQLAAVGRLDGYESAFEASGAQLLKGTARVSSWVARMASAEGAAEYFETLQDDDEAAGVVFTPVSMPALGDEARAFRVSQQSGKFEFTTFVIRLRKGAWVGGVEVTSFAALADFDAALKWAELLAARLP